MIKSIEKGTKSSQNGYLQFIMNVNLQSEKSLKYYPFITSQQYCNL